MTDINSYKINQLKLEIGESLMNAHCCAERLAALQGEGDKVIDGIEDVENDCMIEMPEIALLLQAKARRHGGYRNDEF